MKAVCAGSPGQLEWLDLDVTPLRSGQVRLRPLACGICSTDVKQVKAGYQGGPRFALGHELAAEVVETGPDARWSPGDRVIALPYIPCGACPACLRGQPTLCPSLFENSLKPGGLAERVHVPRPLAERGLFVLPEDLSPELGSLVEPLGCAVQGVEACRVLAGDAVLVIGDGPMGLMCAAVARAFGAAPVIVAGLMPERLAIAREVYADAIINPAEQDLASTVAGLTGGVGADAVLAAVSSAEAVEVGLQSLRPGGVLNAFAGVPQGTTLQLDLRRLHYQQITLTGSFGIGPAHALRALQMLSHGRIDGSHLVTAVFPFEQTAEAVAYAAERRGLKAVVRF